MRSLPHGWYSLVVVFFAASGWFASLWEGDGCNYAIVTGPIVNQLDPSFTHRNPITTLQLGFNSYRELPPPAFETSFDDDFVPNKPNPKPTIPVTNLTTAAGSLLQDWSKNRTAGCIPYPENAVTLGMIDGNWDTATGFAFLGLVLGGAGTTFLCCSLCFVFSKVTWRWTAYELLIAGVCQTISLVAWYRTQLCTWNECKWSKGSMSDLVAVGFWTLAGFLMICNYPSWNYEKSERKDTEDDLCDLEDQQECGQSSEEGGSRDDDDERRYPNAVIS